MKNTFLIIDTFNKLFNVCNLYKLFTDTFCNPRHEHIKTKNHLF